MMVFDTQTGQLTFNVVTPGSFFTCAYPDGKKEFSVVVKQSMPVSSEMVEDFICAVLNWVVEV